MMKQVPEVAQYSLFPLQLKEEVTSLVHQRAMLILQINDHIQMITNLIQMITDLNQQRADLNRKNEEWRLKYNSLKTDYEAAIAEAGHFRGQIQNFHQVFKSMHDILGGHSAPRPATPEFRPSDAK